LTTPYDNVTIRFMSDGAPWWSRDRRQPLTHPPKAEAPERRTGRERRKDTRVPLSLDIALPVQVRGDNGFQRGLARNISEGGMLLEVGDAPPIGSMVEVTLAGPSGVAGGPDAVVLHGEVRHHMAWQYSHHQGTKTMRGVGIRFLEAKNQSEAEATPLSGMLGRTLH
jgi:c-di-GMP-binding flagellar brake protein YcgR